MVKKVLVTGCSGYIGSHLCQMLEKDYEVHGLDLNQPQHPVTRFDTMDINQMFTWGGEYDAVIHLAALVNVSESERIPTQYYQTNINGTINVLRHIKCDNFIFASTGAAELCQSAYGISKRVAEDIVREQCENKGIPFTTFRFYNVIGTAGFEPTNPDGLMYNLIKSRDTKEFTIFGNDYNTSDGTCVRDYVHVLEICDALRTAIEKPANKIECLGHGHGHTVDEMFELFKMVNKHVLDGPILRKFGPRRKGDAPISVLSEVSPYMKHLFSISELLKLP